MVNHFWMSGLNFTLLQSKLEYFQKINIRLHRGEYNLCTRYTFIVLCCALSMWVRFPRKPVALFPWRLGVEVPGISRFIQPQVEKKQNRNKMANWRLLEWFEICSVLVFFSRYSIFYWNRIDKLVSAAWERTSFSRWWPAPWLKLPSYLQG